MADTDLLVVSRGGVQYKITRGELDAYLNDGYTVVDSMLFNGTDACLTRNPTITGNQQTWTWSSWVKRGALSKSGRIFGAGSSTGANANQILSFNASDKLAFSNDSVGTCTTAAVYRDTSAWYHIMIAVDSTQAATADRVKLYVNGEFVAWASTVPISLNLNTKINSTQNHAISRSPNSAASYLDGYLSEINLIDGQALEPSAFGVTGKFGEWLPKKYTGTYGTNGFYLEALDSADLGKDTSGNGNDWTNNNVVQVTDTPTDNFATLNPLNASTGVTLKNGNLSVSNTANQSSSATIKPTSGKWYWELPITVSSTGNYLGIKDADSTATTYAGDAVGCNRTGDIYFNNANTGKNGAPTWSGGVGDIIAIAWDADDKKIWWSKNGQWYTANAASAVAIDISEVVAGNSGYDYSSQLGNSGPYVGCSDAGTNIDINFGQKPLAYAPPTGFKALSTQNLPDATVVPSENFDVGLWTGNGSASGPSVTNLNFKPELLWSKSRSTVANNYLYDIVRSPGDSPNKFLGSNTTDVEQTFNAFTLTDTGFNLATDNIYFNQADQSYVAWNWKAGGTAVTNNEGTIESQVSANPDAGFSVVKTQTGSAGTQTIGHGLDTPPQLIFMKPLEQAGLWATYEGVAGNPAQAYAYLNLNDPFNNDPLQWSETGDVVPTSSVFNINTGYTFGASGVGIPIVAYCFASKEGYSKIGTYEGNSNADGPFIYTGFRPAFIMTKCATSAGEWEMYDTSRGQFNAVTETLAAESSASELNTYTIDILSNGFKQRQFYDTQNGNGKTYIYIAFAEQPFKNANAR